MRPVIEVPPLRDPFRGRRPSRARESLSELIHLLRVDGGRPNQRDGTRGEQHASEYDERVEVLLVYNLQKRPRGWSTNQRCDRNEDVDRACTRAIKTHA